MDHRASSNHCSTFESPQHSGPWQSTTNVNGHPSSSPASSSLTIGFSSSQDRHPQSDETLTNAFIRCDATGPNDPTLVAQIVEQVISSLRSKDKVDAVSHDGQSLTCQLQNCLDAPTSSHYPPPSLAETSL